MAQLGKHLQDKLEDLGSYPDHQVKARCSKQHVGNPHIGRDLRDSVTE